MRLNHPFIQLPWRFDAGRMAQEIGRLDSGWMAHPDRIDGNTALALISLDGGDNDAFRGAMRPTPHLARCPYLQQVIASFDEVFGRSRLMRLEAGHEVREHVDYHYHWHNHVRIHIPVITTPEVIFHCDDARLHMGAGECWIFDSWRRHRVVNGGPRARIHLVIDTAGSSRFWDTVARAEEAMLAGTRLAARHVGYEPGAQPQILTERYNLQPVLAPGEIESLTHDLIASFASVPGNDVAGAAEYRRIMLAFCRDWRALWYRFGIHRPGWPHYTRLVAQTRRAFPELETPLLVDNRMGLVKSAFIGRVLAVALSPEVYEDFIAVPEQTAEAPVAPTLPRRPQPVAPTQPRRPVTEAPPAAATPAARPAPGEDIARNAPCPCGSGQRYKHCHGGGSQ